MDIRKLQNGSDIRGIALSTDKEEKNLGFQETCKIVVGFATWLKNKTGKNLEELKISIGHDSRITAQDFKDWIIYSMNSKNIIPFDCGLASTPAIFMSTVFNESDCDGGIMITASHLPYNRNGFKFFSKEGGLDKVDIKEILETAHNLEDFKEGGFDEAKLKYKNLNLMKYYCDFLKDKIKKEVDGEDFDKPLKDLKIVVDAGNGAGGFYAKDILESLGADISGSQFLEPDGRFPNHEPNPENKQAMVAITKRVVETGADFGLIFDTDVDRSSAVDKHGKEISRNGIVAMAAALIAREHPNTTVVTDSVTGDELTEYLEQCLGLKHLRFKRGYKNVINKAKELNQAGIDCQLAIETSGHGAYKENFFLDDGAYLATKLVIKAAQLKKFGEEIGIMIKTLKEPKEALEKRYRITADDFQNYGDMVLDEFKKWAETENNMEVVEPNYEGVRVNFEGENPGWALLRKSLHDPILPLNVEVKEGSAKVLLNIIEDFLRKYEGVEA